MVRTRATMVHSADIASGARPAAPVPTDVHPGRAADVREAARPGPQQVRRGLTPGMLFASAERVAVRYSRGPGHAARAGPAAAPGAPAVRHGRRTAGCAPRSAGGAGRPSWAGAPLRGAAGALLPGRGNHGPGGVRADRDVAGVTANLPSAMRIGTVGRPLPGVAIRVADDGEVQSRGEVVFPGYWNNPEATREAFTDDGWLRTGDLGRARRRRIPAHHRADEGGHGHRGGQERRPAPIEECIRRTPWSAR